MYHRVLAEPDPMRPFDITAGTFAHHIATLARIFNVMPVDEALDRLSNHRLPARSMCITFDDGYRDNVEVAMPILQRHGLSATFFVTSGVLGTGRMFNDTVLEVLRRLPAGQHDFGWLDLGMHTIADSISRVGLAETIITRLKYLPIERRDEVCERLIASVDGPLPVDLMMTPEQVGELEKGGQLVGGHTVTHATLSAIDDGEARRQIQTNRDHLSSMLNSPPRFFAYPNGRPERDYNEQHARMVRDAGYHAAFSTAWGQVAIEDNRYQLSRCGTLDVGVARFVTRLMLHGRRPLPLRPRTVAA